MSIVTNKAFLEGYIYDAIPIEQLISIPILSDHTAVIYGGYVLPIRYSSATVNSRPGLYYSAFAQIVLPVTEEDKIAYSTDTLAYSGSKTTFADVIAAREKLSRDEFNHLVSNDNIYVPVIDEVNDTPLSMCLKMAVGEKQCNINRYSSRFGDDFNNDRRKLNGNDITAAKYATFGRNMDIRTTLIIEDMNPDVANPMGKRIIRTWVGDGINDKAYEDYYRNMLTGSPDI